MRRRWGLWALVMLGLSALGACGDAPCPDGLTHPVAKGTAGECGCCEVGEWSCGGFAHGGQPSPGGQCLQVADSAPPCSSYVESQSGCRILSCQNSCLGGRDATP